MASLEDLLAQQEQAMNKIQRVLPNFKKLGQAKWTAAITKQRIEAIETAFTKCEELDLHLKRTSTDTQRATLKYFASNFFFQCEESYQETLDFLTNTLSSLESSHVSAIANPAIKTSAKALSRLPKINLPSFDGSYLQWESFRDRFRSLIHIDESLSKVDKLHYLLSSVKDEALRTLSHLPLTDANYEVAWNALTTRYENKKQLINEHISVLLNLPSITTESAVELRTLRDAANASIQALKNLNRPVDFWDDILVHIVSKKLDPGTRRAWELHHRKSVENPSYRELDDFMELQSRTLEALPTVTDSRAQIYDRKVRSSSIKPTLSHCATSSQNKSSKRYSITPNSSRQPVQCSICRESHPLFQCPSFLSSPPAQRFETIKVQHRCHNCLSEKHTTDQCSSKHRCRVCFKHHHTLLHSATDNELLQIKAEPVQTTACTMASNTISSTSPASGTVLLATARVRVAAPNGRWAMVRALLDQGSTATLMSENLAQLLRLRRTKCSLHVVGVNGVQSTARHTANISISPPSVAKPAYAVNAIILASLTNYQPRRIRCPQRWDHTRDLRLAESDPFSTDPIEIIIGADLYGDILRRGTRKGRRDQPIAQNTVFGWVLSGRVASANQSDIVPSHNVTVLKTLDNNLRRFWEIEELPCEPQLTAEEHACEDHFLNTHTRDRRGRYLVRLPFKGEPPINIGQSRHFAMRNLLRLEQRIQADEEKSSAYKDFMTEYESLGHMTRIEPTETSPLYQPYYIPHHAIFRQTSTTSRIRVVFNASAATTSGKSLNEYLAVGPKLQVDLSAVILRWRQFRFVLTADIEKMYRQILVDPRDHDYQRILWRPSNSNNIAEYHLRTITYGTTCAPFLALRVLKQLASDEGGNYPLAVSVLRNQTYVDDCIFGGDNQSLITHTKDQLVTLLQKGGFNLRKWASNCSTLLRDIAPADHGLAYGKELKPDESLHILGISWQPNDDVFRFPLRLPNTLGNTKREILSTIAKFYDPLGWIAPVLIKAKVLLQQLWTLHCDWDSDLPNNIQADWAHYCRQLSTLEHVRIPRWTQCSPDLAVCELHAFSDASTKAYAAAVYLRCVSRDHTTTVTLLIAKSKVAPLKTVSVPRLELCAAHLLARLLKFVATTLKMESRKTYCWTDSAIVLAWLSQPPSRWQTFVANRVALIQELTPTATWRHVATTHNPADCASRGISPTELIDHSLWWSGPEWLTNESQFWPFQPLPSVPELSLEKRGDTVSHTVSTTEKWDLSTRYSTWSKLLRVTAWVLRFLHQLKDSRPQGTRLACARSKHSPVHLHRDEIQKAKQYWVKEIQRDSFPQEIASLTNGQPLAASSAISSLNPFLDANGLLRVGGRLRHANLAQSQKHPVLLRSHHLVDLLIRHHHYLTLHGGAHLTTASLRQEYWIVRARPVIRAVLYSCTRCTRERAVIPNELMGDLPSVRVNRSARAFQHTGVDYAGPIAVRTAPGRGYKSHKAYIALFICMTVKAIHLELVSDYSSTAFIAAYHRFVSRRGLPTSLYSDNGTTFHGANKELRAAQRKAIDDNEFHNLLASHGVEWHFLPPAAPHFGGLWEAGVKSVKHHLRRCIGSQTLTFEEMTTLLCRIEACLNSRPIAPCSDNYDDYQPLTPGHFLIGTTLISHPEPSVLQLNEHRLSRWQLIQHLTQDFWKAWSSDYVQSLQQRPKWRSMQRLTTVGRLVLLRNPNAPPSQWEMGRIIACHPGSDGLTRVVTIKTAQSEYQRPIVKLCFLPVHLNDEEEQSRSTTAEVATPTSTTT